MVRDDDDVTPEHSWRRSEGVGSHGGAAARNSSDAGEAAEATEVVVEVPSDEGAIRANELVSEYPENLDVEEAVASAGVLEPYVSESYEIRIRVQWYLRQIRPMELVDRLNRMRHW